jgi:chromosome segregation ATPase
MSQFITVLDSTGIANSYCIEEGASKFAGSADHCEIKLQGEDVAPIHCMFSTVEGELKIQDWNTGGKTLLNGFELQDESQFCDGDEVSIGEIQILVGQQDATADGAVRASADTVAYGTSDSNDELQQELQKIKLENSKLEAEFAATAQPDNAVDSLYDDPFASGDTELLRDEIESLTVELAERDQQVCMLKQQLESGGGGDMEETNRLVTRMEQLLDELQSADDRIRTFEELLRTSDDATQAEQEERRQLESWLEQIEDRVTAREEEAKAETDRLNGRVHDLLAQQKHHEQVIEKALRQRTSGSGGDASDELVQSLQAQVQDLQSKWQQAQDECEQLASQRSTAPDGSDSQVVAELKQKIMQLEMGASRERAEVARERAELAKLQAEMDQKCRTTSLDSDSEIRLKAMREHLRELHSEEEVEREQRRQQSLGGRIASLFSRIESR